MPQVKALWFIAVRPVHHDTACAHTFGLPRVDRVEFLHIHSLSIVHIVFKAL